MSLLIDNDSHMTITRHSCDHNFHIYVYSHVSHVMCDQNQKDAHRLCDSESARMTMPNKVKHEIFGNQLFGVSNKKNNSGKTLINSEIFMTLDLHKNNHAKHCQTQDICIIMT